MIYSAFLLCVRLGKHLKLFVRYKLRWCLTGLLKATGHSILSLANDFSVMEEAKGGDVCAAELASVLLRGIETMSWKLLSKVELL